MSIQSEIAALLAKAKPLRELSPEDSERAGLGALVDQINTLRKQESDEAHGVFLEEVRASLVTPEEGADADEPPKRKPGRPKAKAD